MIIGFLYLYQSGTKKTLCFTSTAEIRGEAKEHILEEMPYPLRERQRGALIFRAYHVVSS